MAGMWGYKLLPLPLSHKDGIDESTYWLNQEGMDGWEVIAVVPKMSTPPTLDCLAIMKRRFIESHGEQRASSRPAA